MHVDPLAKPMAYHTPFSIPIYWKQKIHDNFIRDEAMGILEKVPQGQPTEWSLPENMMIFLAAQWTCRH